MNPCLLVLICAGLAACGLQDNNQAGDENQSGRFNLVEDYERRVSHRCYLPDLNLQPYAPENPRKPGWVSALAIGDFDAARQGMPDLNSRQSFDPGNCFGANCAARLSFSYAVQKQPYHWLLALAASDETHLKAVQDSSRTLVGEYFKLLPRLRGEGRYNIRSTGYAPIPGAGVPVIYQALALSDLIRLDQTASLDAVEIETALAHLTGFIDRQLEESSAPEIVPKPDLNESDQFPSPSYWFDIRTMRLILDNESWPAEAAPRWNHGLYRLARGSLWAELGKAQGDGELWRAGLRDMFVADARLYHCSPEWSAITRIKLAQALDLAGPAEEVFSSGVPAQLTGDEMDGAHPDLISRANQPITLNFYEESMWKRALDQLEYSRNPLLWAIAMRGVACTTESPQNAEHYAREVLGEYMICPDESPEAAN